MKQPSLLLLHPDPTTTRRPRMAMLVVGFLALAATATAAENDYYKTVLRKPGDDGSKAYRIPGLATSTKGTLLAVYDIRYGGFGDLPGDIDVGLRRSTDGGRTWEPQQVIMNFDKAVPDSKGNGVGDPAILVDRKTGTIFVVALWSQGNRAWNGSGPGLKPEETGQLVLAKSTDDGKTWSAPVNLTAKVSGRDPKWRLFFNGPGAGIQTRDGTLVFAAQFRDAEGTPHSCFLASRDAGETWAVSQPAIAAKPPTSESQIAELSDGSLLLTMRDESRSGKRAWARFQPAKNLPDGTWDKWYSDLPDSTCMASIVRHPSGALIFSNPASSKNRIGMTLRISDDDGKTWSAGRVLDPRPAAYSCLSILDDGSIGVLYETGEKNSAETLVYANVTLDWIRQGTPEPPKQGQLRLNPLFRDHAVLQRELPVPVTGKAAPNQRVAVEFAAAKLATTSDNAGQWSVELPAMQASSQSQQLIVSCNAERVVVNDILIGEVWLCAGQSNMEFPVARANHAAEALAAADMPLLRLHDRRPASRGVFAQPFSHEIRSRLQAETFFQGAWQVASRQTAADFSAIGFEFGRQLQQHLHVPVGIISVTVGGSPTEAWLESNAMSEDPALRELVRGDWLKNPALGQWCRERGQQNLGTAATADPGESFGLNHPYKPGFLWASGIQPLLPCAIRGVLWYQGESNAQEAPVIDRHRLLFPRLIANWRAQFKQPKLPFLFCQLSSIGTAQGYAAERWPEFRNQQRELAEEIPHTAMIVTSDVGHLTDVHPREKRIVAERLLRAAQAIVYGEKVPYRGPRLEKVHREQNRIVVTLACAEQQLRTSDMKPVAGFELGDADKSFRKATAQLQGNQVILEQPEGLAVRWVRYGWQPYCEGNLVDAAGLPASTFEAAVSSTF